MKFSRHIPATVYCAYAASIAKYVVPVFNFLGFYSNGLSKHTHCLQKNFVDKNFTSFQVKSRQSSIQRQERYKIAVLFGYFISSRLAEMILKNFEQKAWILIHCKEIWLSLSLTPPFSAFYSQLFRNNITENSFKF